MGAGAKNGAVSDTSAVSSFAPMSDESGQWFAVRCVFDVDHPEGTPYLYEERITLWRASSFDEAIALAEEEANNVYADDDCQYTGLAQAYESSIHRSTAPRSSRSCARAA